MSTMSAALWKEAHDDLRDKDKVVFQKYSSSSAAPDQLQDDIKTQIELSKGGPIKLPNGEQFFVRDAFRTISQWVKMFVEVGDNVVQYDPGHAALPWAALRALLKATTNNQDKHAAVLEGVERLSFYMAWSRVEEVYLSDPPASPELRRAFVKLYSSILRFAARSFRFLENKMGRLFSAFTSSDSKFRRDLAEMTECQQEIRTRTRQLADGINRSIPEKILQLRKDLEQPIARIEGDLQYVQDALDRKYKEEILDWASQIPFMKHYQTAKGKAMAGTGTWLLDDRQFVDWRTTSRSQILWLLGGAGTGKSTLAAIFLHSLMELHQSHHEPYPVFFFCSRNSAEQERASPESILRSLVRQGSDLPGGPPLHQTLEKRFEQRRVNGEMSPAEATEIILDTIQRRPLTYIIVDALDECDPENRHILIDALKDIVAQSQSLVKVFVTSRTSHADIRVAMDGFPALYIDASRNQEDIRRFVVSEVDQAIRKRRLLPTEKVSEDLRQQIIDRLCDGATGMFRWVELQLKFLYTIRKLSVLVERLGKLPPDLEKSYQDLYKYQMENLGEEQAEIVRRILSWLLVAKRPLSTAETCELVCAPEDPDMSIETVLDLCFDLVTLDSQLDQFRFAHLSVREFLERKEEYGLAFTQGMAMTSCLRSMSKQNDFVPTRYDALYWPFHAEDAVKHAASEAIKKGLDAFFLDKVLSSWWNHYLHRSVDTKHGWESSPVERRIQACLGHTNRGTHGRCFLTAACFGLVDQLEWLWETLSSSSGHGKDNKLQQSALSLSCRYNQARATAFLLEHGVDVNSRDDEYGMSPLSWAAMKGHIDIVKLLLAWPGVDVDTRSVEDASPLSLAARKGHTAIIELLLAQGGVEVDSPGPSGQSPLSLAAWNGHAASVKLLIERGADINSRSFDGQSPLSWSTGSGHIAVVELLLKQDDVDVNSRDIYGLSALSLAAKTNDTAIAELLIKRGADVNACDKSGRSPLHAATEFRHTAMTQLLVERGADVCPQSVLGKTPLLLAAEYGCIAIAELLIKQGADVNVRDRSGRSALYLAVQHCQVEFVELLLARPDVEIDACDEHGQSPLALAVEHGRVAIVTLLIERGADITLRDEDGWSALSLAEETADTTILETLRKRSGGYSSHEGSQAT